MKTVKISVESESENRFDACIIGRDWSESISGATEKDLFMFIGKQITKLPKGTRIQWKGITK